jgi:site-specific recombinase XerD
MTTPCPKTTFPTLLQQFFLERLIQQRNVSLQTVAAYRDSFCLLLRFAQRHLGKAPEQLALADLNAPVMLAFLNYLENERHNKVRSRNARFTAIRSFLVRYACAAVRIRGKGRKERSVPLWRTTVTEIRRWLARTQAGRDQPLFPGWSGTRMSRPAVTARLQLAGQNAVKVCPQLAQREVSPHVIRHSTAMHLLESGVDITSLHFGSGTNTRQLHTCTWRPILR